MSFGGIAGADAICANEAAAKGLPNGLRFAALLVDEAGCDGKPCRRTSVTPGLGDSAIDWVIAPMAASLLRGTNLSFRHFNLRCPLYLVLGLLMTDRSIPRSRYFRLDNVTLVALSNSSRMLGQNNATLKSARNQVGFFLFFCDFQ